jgi:glycosyltransferase involved in cell wall biosynthesis
VAWTAFRRLRASRTLLVTRSHGLLHVFHEARDLERALGHDATTRLNRWHEAADRALVGRAIRAADLALFLNARDRDYAVDRLGVGPDRARTVPNGVSDDLLGGPVPAPRAGRAPRIAWVGGYDFRKGTRYAAAALAPLLREHPEVTATFLGAGRSAEEVRADYPEDVAARIEVVPRYEREQLGALLRAADIVLMPSTAEGFSLALVEAMASGLAPVTTDVGAAAEVVRDGVDGIVVPSRDVDGLRRALARLVGDRDSLDRMRASAQARSQQFTWDRAAEENLYAYEEALERRRGGA